METVEMVNDVDRASTIHNKEESAECLTDPNVLNVFSLDLFPHKRALENYAPIVEHLYCSRCTPVEEERQKREKSHCGGSASEPTIFGGELNENTYP
jgi:hypothetical protein